MTKLKIGMKAPNIELVDWRGSTFNLENVSGKKWIAFFRYASCPLCNLRVNEMIKRFEELTKSGLQIIAIFQSEPESVAKYVGKQEPPFLILCDPSENSYERYGLQASILGMMSPKNMSKLISAMKSGFRPGKMEGSVTRIPADFLIDENNIIQEVYYGETIGDHIPFVRVLKFTS
ncbi:MAG: peroxiredoxin-like family protein [Bacteriovoracaceae bacterium]